LLALSRFKAGYDSNYLAYVQADSSLRSVRTDRIIFGESGFTEEEQRLYSAGVEAVTAGTAQALAMKYDFVPHRRLLDLGGGTGSFLLPILARYPTLECTLYDLPQVAAATRQRMASDPVGARIQVIAGDFFKDSIPKHIEKERQKIPDGIG
jgi:tRNA1(Val) A37 N6-methylase TrmN6